MSTTTTHVNKVIYSGQTLIDLTSDTVTADKLLSGAKAHDKSGAQITGACTYDVDSTDGTAGVAEILKGKTAYARGSKLTGTMPNNGGVTKTITTASEVYTIPQGYHDGSGKVSIDTTEQAKLVASNIRDGVTVLGVTGTMTGTEDVVPQSKTITPTNADQTVLPDTEATEGYNYLSQVIVKAIPYAESSNSAGGTTVTIG